MKRPALIIFDCDGVLVDSEPITNAFLLQDLARYGLHLSMADCDRLFVGGTMQGASEVARSMGADLPDDWVDDYYRRVYAHLGKGVPLVKGVRDVLVRIDARQIQHCVVSNGSEEKMRITLGQNGLWDRFQGAMFSAHAHGTAKPDPELLLIASRQFSVAPQDCVVIDDSPSGCQGAANAGMPCIGFAEHTDPGRLSATGATVIRSMAELPPLIGLT
jgi:HAD superfamily hydrolase (TIGR01509 family)